MPENSPEDYQRAKKTTEREQMYYFDQLSNRLKLTIKLAPIRFCAKEVFLRARKHGEDVAFKELTDQINEDFPDYKPI